MNLPPETPAGLRRAALTLHSLGQVDRDWLLQQLPGAMQQALCVLLAELNDLGIPPDAAVIRAALDEAPAQEAMSAAQAQGLCHVLANEVPVLQSLLLAALPLAQREAVLRHWPHELLARPSAVSGHTWTPALHEAVMRSWHDLAQKHEGQP